MPRFRHLTFITSILFALVARGAEKKEEFPPQPPVKALSPEAEQKTIQLPPGYRLELVLSEPHIKEPVACAFDGNGRMFVAEMRSYMQDIDGTDEMKANGRVSLHWSSKGDGVLDRHTVFADNLLLPRILMPLSAGQCVIGETNTLDLYLYTDTNGDGVSDKKELWFQGGPRGGNLEHQPSGLVWAIDNGMYSTYNAYRLRWTPSGVQKEPTAPNDGQWGLGQDNHGKIFYMNAGGEKGPQSFQVPTVYGMFNPRAQFAPGFAEVWPASGVRDFQGGHPRVREPEGTLNHFTATSGAEVYRGDRLPGELHNQLFFGEPVGRLVRRAKVESIGGLTVLSNPHQEQKSEFIRSTDLCFRPLNLNTAPDGTLYIVDMYRGIIQEGNWVQEGSYLRKVVQQYSFDKVAGHGRIWRLVHDTTKPGPQPTMDRDTPAQLVAHLAHPNGWWRDTAQKLLVLKQDKSVVLALEQMARKDANYLARLHALWTLEGLDSLKAELIREKLRDTHPQVRVAAIRVSESLIKKGDPSLPADVRAMNNDKDADVVMQSLLTARHLNLPAWKELIASTIATTTFAGVKEIGNTILNPSTPAAAQTFTPEQKKVLTAGAEIYNTLCASCHGPDGKGMPMAGAPAGTMLAPSFVGSKTITGARDAGILVLLNGLAGEIDGKKYEGLMISMATNDDTWIANVLSYVRNSFGNRASFVSPQDVARLRPAAAKRTQPWTIQELRAAIPQPIDRKGWKVTASHNSENAKAAIDGKSSSRWDTRTSQAPGMWFVIELPHEMEIAAVRLDAADSTRDFPRGYKVEVSTDNQTWTKPVAEGKGSAAVTDIEFPPAKAKYVRITQTGSVQGLFWSIHELELISPRPAPAKISAR
ncbi:MAG TPA: discoidin domain-containing protein [Chthoniobacteraceae bacterium]|nr:discoidin domain-containing protein [Chthoniobacteraceae bacterium]